MLESTTIPDDAPATATATTGTGRFFAAALGLTWSLQLPALLAQRGLIPGPAPRYLLPAVIGGFGPLLAAMLVARREPGVRALFRPLGRPPRVRARWYALALATFGIIYTAGAAVFALAAGHPAGPWLYLPENAAQVALMFVVPFAEEIGWRGFALPRLQQRHAPLAAALRLGVVWALWHTVMFILQGFSPLMFVLGMANIVAGSVVMSWLWNRTRGSLLIALVAHAGAHLDNPHRALPAHPTPFFVYVGATIVAAAVLVIADRKVWRRT